VSNLNDLCLDLAWSHWTGLGVRGVFAPPPDATDLEALILFTTTLGHIDPRLHDEALDWCAKFARETVAISRLRRLLTRLPSEQQEAFGEFAGALHQHVDLKWPAARPPVHRYRLSGKSRLPTPLVRPSLLQLRARRLFGTSARVEIMMHFVLSPEGTLASASELAALGYAKQNISVILDDFVDAATLERVQSGNQHQYRLLRHGTWRELLEPLPTSWPPWHLRLPILAGLRSTLERVEKKADIVKDIEVAKELQRHLPAFRMMGFADGRVPTKGHASRGIVEWADEALIRVR
jgi:hypothetical protein